VTVLGDALQCITAGIDEMLIPYNKEFTDRFVDGMRVSKRVSEQVAQFINDAYNLPPELEVSGNNTDITFEVYHTEQSEEVVRTDAMESGLDVICTSAFTRRGENDESACTMIGSTVPTHGGMVICDNLIPDIMVRDRVVKTVLVIALTRFRIRKNGRLVLLLSSWSGINTRARGT
jgi:hypothetical protein